MSGRDKLWGGAFQDEPDALAWSFGQSIETDAAFWREELEVASAHVDMLGNVGVLDRSDVDKILVALSAMQADPSWLEAHRDAEDIHGAVEAEVVARVGDIGRAMAAARSRNDQVATTSRIWASRRLGELCDELRGLQRTLVDLGERHANDPMLGTTHMQAAQPITLGYHLIAYFWMVERDIERATKAASTAMRDCPLGSCALAGTSLPIDREATARALGFEQPSPSALDSVSDRDFIGDSLHVCAQAMIHLSRLCGELVLWSTPQFGYVRIADAYSTGSSLMPQKRNPDMAELVRGRAAEVIGCWTAFMGMMRGQPLAYNRDMQDDKPGLVRAMRLTQHSASLCAAMLDSATFDMERMAKDAGAAGATATDLADHLVRRGVPFRDAHEQVGKWIRTGDLPSDQESLEALSVGGSLKGRKSHGAPGAFSDQIAQARAILGPRTQ